MRFLATGLVVFFFSNGIVWAQDAVVGIYSDLGNRKGQGTGFFYSSSGDILTAYHVIEGARALEIFHQGRRYKDNQIIVESVNPDTDLAHLRVINLPNSTRYYPLADHTTQWVPGQRLNSIGYLRGIPNQHLNGYFTQQGKLMSGQIRDKQGHRLFARTNVELLPVYMAGIYSGASGGPILLQNQVVGVLSGSFDEGGSFTWGIPVEYMHNMQAIGRRASQISDWPSFSMMNHQYWRNLRASLRVDSELTAKLDQYFTLLESVFDAYENMFVKANSARSMLILAMRVMSSVGNTINQSTTEESLRQRLEPSIQGALLPSLKEFEKAGNHFDEQFAKLNYTLHGVLREIDKLHDGLPRTEHNLKNIYENEVAVRSIVAKFKPIQVRQEKFLNELADLIGQLPVIEAPVATAGDEGLRHWLRSYQSGLQQLGEIIKEFTASQTLAEVDKELSVWQEMGELCERLVYQKWDRGEQMYRYSSNREAYSIVMPRGWVLKTPELLEFFTNVKLEDPVIDLDFMRTGHFGDQIKFPGVDTITTIPGPRLQLSDLYNLPAQSEMFKKIYATLFNNLRDFHMTQRQIVGYDGILITAKFGSEVKVGKIYYAFINTPNFSLWVHCTIHSGASVDDCKSAISSLSFKQ